MLLINSLTQTFNPLQLLVQENAESDKYAAELLRNKVSEIIGSYHHKFDYFYECVQNSVDACEKAFYFYEGQKRSAEYSPLIQIIINLEDNYITVVDNGLGMPKDSILRYFFTPYATLKPSDNQNNETRQRGEKGVGATFLSYGTNSIKLTSLSIDNELTAGCLLNGYDWITKKQGLLPMPEVIPCESHKEIEGIQHGTAVTITFSETTNISNLAEFGDELNQWEAILRLHTALGYIDLGEPGTFFKALRANLFIIKRKINAETTEEIQTITESKLIETGYLYPHLISEASVRLGSLTRDKKGNLPERQRDMSVLWENFTYEQVSELVEKRMGNMSYLRHKTRDSLSNILNEHKPEAYVAFVYGADFWEVENHKIWGEDNEGQFKPGIVFATKSQKIGEQRRIDLKFRTGDFNRFFILLSMKNLKGDIGRKSLREEVVEFSNFFANAVQNRFTSEDDCLSPSPGPFDESQDAEIESTKDRAYGLDKLGINWLHFSRVPQEEQDVVAIFFDLIGLNLIRGYEIYSTHISRTYDGVGRFVLKDSPENRYDPAKNRLGIASDKFVRGEVKSPNKCIIEFKFNSDGLVKDVRSGYKRLQDIKWLICWEIGNRHLEEGISIIEITEPAYINRRDYYGVTHLMTENQDKVYVICLKKVLEILNKGYSAKVGN